MTFLEKLKQDNPERKIDSPASNLGCPYTYGYETSFHRPCATMDCAACWNREMPGTEPTPTNDPMPDGGASEAVEHPAHYNAGGIECIDAIEAALACQSEPVQAFLTGQVLKYLWFWPLKGGVEDLEKARFYLERLIARAQRAAENTGNG